VTDAIAVDDLAHVIFPLEVVDHWPPVGAERIWAVPVGDDRYRVANVPWFVYGVAEDDLIRAVADKEEKWPHFVEFIEWAGNYVIRLMPTGKCTEQNIMDAFAELDITGEAMGGDPLSMVALNVPADADLTRIKALMLAGKADGRWEYEEAAIDHRWRNA
jgi:hypothetical protein